MNEKVKATRASDESALIQMNIDMNELQLKIERYIAVQTIFMTDFPSFINMKACKILESYMNNFLTQTKDNLQIALQNDKKGINFYYRANSEPEWRSLKMTSGYESALTTLAFKTSVAYAFGSDMIFLDEPEANADIKAAEKLFEVISAIGNFNQMFIITHKAEILPILFDKGAHGYNVQKGVFTELQY